MPYWDHLKEAWDRRNDPNILFIFYEDMKKDIHNSIGTIAKFMGKSYTKEQIELLAEHLKFKCFKNNDSVNGFEMREVKVLNESEGDFVRNGVVNGSDCELTPELKMRMNTWIHENLETSGIVFPDLI